MKKQTIALLLFCLAALAYVVFDQQTAIVKQLTDKDTSTMLQSIAAIVAILTALYYLIAKYLISAKQEKQPDQEETTKDDLSSDSHYEPTLVKPLKNINLDDCPYRGLEAFTQEDAHLFFGRQREIRESLSYIGRPTSNEANSPICYWLQIQGNSGAGKSSLVRAGLLPAIEDNRLQLQTGIKHWVIFEPMLPGESPLNSLATLLERCLKPEPADRNIDDLERRLANSEKALANLLKEYSQKDSAFVLVVDQFEELFTFADPQERKQFDALLAYALQSPECPLCLITTVRLDFLGGFEKLPQLSEMYNRHCKPYLLKTISREGLQEAIEKPAAQYNLDVSEIVHLLLKDAQGEEGVLPLVENALQVLWQQREGNKLSGELYLQKGGLVGLLEEQADQLLDAIDKIIPKGKQHALDLLLALTRVNDEGRNTRRRLSLQEALLNASGGKKANEENGKKIIDYLTGRIKIQSNKHTEIRLRLLTTIGQNQEDQSIDIIHETLIRSRGKDPKTNKRYGYWKTLYDFIEKHPDRSFYREQIGQQAEQWDESKGIQRWRKLANWRDLKHFKPIPLAEGSAENHFRLWSQRAVRAQLGLLLLVGAFVLESYYWTLKHQLPPAYMLMQQKFRLIRLGVIEPPIPEVVEIPLPKEPYQIGEYDEEIGKDYSNYLKREGSYNRQNFGYPNYTTKIKEPFAIGKYEVSYEQYDYYIWEQNTQDKNLSYPQNAPSGGVRSKQAVAYISWNNVNNYLAWLGEKTEHQYRLPTEAEWEYAARAGTKTAYAFESIKDNANCNGCNSPWGNKTIAPIGSFQPNDWGVYDMHGNVWELTCSEWKTELDQQANMCISSDNKTGKRTLRGGSWSGNTEWLRSSARYGHDATITSNYVGFRIVRLSRTN